MELTKEMEAFFHLFARAFAKTHGSETPGAFADTVVEHAKAEAAKDTPVEAGNATAGDPATAAQ